MRFLIDYTLARKSSSICLSILNFNRLLLMRLLIDYTLDRKSSSICLSILLFNNKTQKTKNIFKKINIGLLTNYLFIQKFDCFQFQILCVFYLTHHASYDYNIIFAKNILYKLLAKSKKSSNLSSNLDKILDGWLRIFLKMTKQYNIVIYIYHVVNYSRQTFIITRHYLLEKYWLIHIHFKNSLTTPSNHNDGSLKILA